MISPQTDTRRKLSTGRQHEVRAAFADLIAGALVLARGMRGSAEAPATRRPATPRTRSRGSSAVSGSVPIAAVHAGWPVVATVARIHASSSPSVFTAGPGWISLATADAGGSVEAISRVRRIARMKAARSAAVVSVFNWIAGGTPCRASEPTHCPGCPASNRIAGSTAPAADS
jgi:hypothetical protein